MKRILITGGSGAFGRAVAALMNQRGGYQIFTADRQGANDSSKNIVCDVCNPEQLSAAFDQAEPDVVLHLAAAFTGSLDEAFATNVIPAKQILELVRQAGLKTRVVLIGSAAEYGVITADENPIREDRALAPVSVYGVSKAWQTQLVGLYKSLGVDVVCARVFNLIGPGMSDRLFAGRLQNQIEQVLAKKKSVIEIGSLAAIRDYISTEDAAVQLLAIAAHGKSGEIYHVASGEPVMMREVLLRELNKFKLDPSIVRESNGLSSHTGYDVPAIYADITKTEQLVAAESLNA